jgi:hypothetical protein
MDGNQFDALTRALASSPSRRGMLRAVAAGALAAIGFHQRADAAPPVNCPVHDLCNGACCAPTAEACCAGKCVTVSVDRIQCAACGKTCPAGETCCGETCRLLRTDPNNCGACGHDCGHGRCVKGACACDSGYKLCNGVCINPDTNDNHCGSCGHKCSENRDCVNGKCECTGYLKECGGVCINPYGDDHHCGSCHNACPANAHCQGGECQCEDGTKKVCGARCVDVSSNVKHCGACDTPCGDGQVCSEYQCFDACDPGLPACPGEQVRSAAGFYCNCECICPRESPTCSCPEGTGCAAKAICGKHTTAHLCCPYPQTGMACKDSPGKHDGFAICCERGLDCPHCPSGSAAFGGRANVCAPPGESKTQGGSANCGDNKGETIGGDSYCD